MISAVRSTATAPLFLRAKLCGNDHFWGGEHVQSNHSHYFRNFEVGRIFPCKKKLRAYSSSDRDVPGILQLLGETTRIIGGSIGYLELKFNSMCILPSPPKRLLSSARFLKRRASDVSSTKSFIFTLQQRTLSCGDKQTSSTTLVLSLCSFLNS